MSEPRHLPYVVIYSKPGCHLCDEAKAVLTRLRAQIPFELQEVDISADAALLERYGDSIPVVFVNGRLRARYRVHESRFEHILRAEQG